MGDFLTFMMKDMRITREQARDLLEFARLSFSVEWEIIDQPLSKHLLGETWELYTNLSHQHYIPDAVKGSPDDTWNIALGVTCFALKLKAERIKAAPG